MQSLQTQTIDDYTVITGFQARPINPEETRKQNIPVFLKSDESKALKLKQAEQDRNRLSFIEAGKKAGYHLKLANGYISEENGTKTVIEGVDIIKNKAASKTWDKKRIGLIGVMELCNEELKPLALACREKGKDILRAGPVFFEPRLGEVIKSESELEDLRTKFSGKTETQSLLEDGNYVDDFRGQKYHKKTSGKWVETTIDKLNSFKITGSKYTEELTEIERTEIEDQKETERITALTSEEKTSEYNSNKSELAGKSQIMETELKFDGVVDFEKQAQAFYTSELDKLKTKYGVK